MPKTQSPTVKVRAGLESQVALADAIDEALATGEATKQHGNNSGYQVGTHEIATAEVDRWRKLRAIPEEEPTELPAMPTSARPGTPAKIEVLRQRYEAGVPLYHPDDESRPVLRKGACIVLTLLADSFPDDESLPVLRKGVQ